MRFLILVLLFPATVSAQDFTTPRAKRALSEYESDLERVQKRYLVSLSEAEKVAKETGNPDEAARITEEADRIKKNLAGDSVVRTRNLLIGVVLVCDRPDGPAKVELKPDGIAEISTLGRGRWEVFSSDTVIVRIQGTTFFYKFDSSFSRFTIDVYRHGSTLWKEGRRVSPLGKSIK